MKKIELIQQIINGNHLEIDELKQAKAVLKLLLCEADNRLKIYQPKQIRKIEFNAKEYRDKTNANSYFSAKIYISYSNNTYKILLIPFDYGYETQYLNKCLSVLNDKNILDKKIENLYELREYLEKNEISFVTEIQQNCSEKDVKKWGAEQW